MRGVGVVLLVSAALAGCGGGPVVIGERSASPSPSPWCPTYASPAPYGWYTVPLRPPPSLPPGCPDPMCLIGPGDLPAEPGQTPAPPEVYDRKPVPSGPGEENAEVLEGVLANCAPGKGSGR